MAKQQQKKQQPKKASSKTSGSSQRRATSHVALILSIVALVIAVAAAAYLVFQQMTSDSGSATANISAPAKDSSQLHGQWTLVNLSSGDHYYGHLSYSKPLGAYILWNAWRPNASTGTATTAAVTYSKVGSELHKPLPYLVIDPQVLYTWQDISDSSSVLQAIEQTAGYTDVAEPTTADIQSAKYSAVFLADDSVLFGTVVHQGTQLGVKNAYVMTRKNTSAKTGQPITSLNDLQLVPQKNITPGAGDTLWVNPGALVMYETLSAQSPVVQAIQGQS